MCIFLEGRTVYFAAIATESCNNIFISFSKFIYMSVCSHVTIQPLNKILLYMILGDLVKFFNTFQLRYGYFTCSRTWVFFA